MCEDIQGEFNFVQSCSFNSKTNINQTLISAAEPVGPASSEPIVTPRHISEVGKPQDVAKYNYTLPPYSTTK